MSDPRPPAEVLSEVIGLMEWLNDCDPWYAEHDGIDIAAKATEAREALVAWEDAGYLADAAVHMADHIKQLGVHCEDEDNVRHFAAKIRAHP